VLVLQKIRDVSSLLFFCFQQNIRLTYLGYPGNLTNMNTTAKKAKKTFPLEIEDALHKALKHKAIELDISLHAYIIDALVSRVNEESVVYSTGGTSEENQEEK
jgi:hypothetical protein